MPDHAASSLGPVLDALYQTVYHRKNADPESSYTAQLFHQGRRKIAQKVGEEGVETALAGVADDTHELVRESADLFYHLMVLWVDMNIHPDEIMNELTRRIGTSGLAEKAARTP